jgi:hypothetical protein
LEDVIEFYGIELSPAGGALMIEPSLEVACEASYAERCMKKQHPYRATIAPISEEKVRPLWSVMIPTYHCAPYLRETLSSVVAQDPGPERMQIEVIDDHSIHDNPAAVVEELGHGRVGFYQQLENVGHVRNFETCLQRSRGELIHLLHGDDYVRDGFYRKMQRVFERNPGTGAVFCRYILMDEQSHWTTISHLEQPESGVLHNWLERIAAGQRIVTPSIVVRREVYEKLGGFDRRIVCCGEDWEMWVRIATHYPVGYEVEPLAVYRYKPLHSLTPSRVIQIMQDMRMAAEIIQSYLPSHLPHSIAHKLINKARESYACWPLTMAGEMLAEGNIVGGVTQIREILKSSCAPRVIARVMRQLLRCKRRWIGRKLHPTG